MDIIEAVVFLSILICGLVLAWAKGVFQSSSQLRDRATQLLALADAKDAYQQTFLKSLPEWRETTGLGPIVRKATMIDEVILELEAKED